MGSRRRDQHASESAIAPLLKQLFTLETDGVDVEALLSLPPLIIDLERFGDDCADGDTVEGKDPTSERNASGQVTNRHDGLGPGEEVKVRVRDQRNGSKAKETCPRRLALVHSVRMFPALLLCLDGGTWASASGVSVSAKERNHFLSSLTRSEQQRPYQLVWLEVEDTVRAWCERTRPGDKAFLQVALCGLDVKSTHALAQITIEKPRANTTAEMGGMGDEPANPPPPPPTSGLWVGSAAQQRLQQRGAATTNAAGNAANARAGSTIDLPFEDPDIEAMRKAGKFDHLTYQGDVKIGELSTTQTWEARVAKGWYGVDTPLRKRTLVRLPVVPEQLGTRPLPDSAWGNLPAITRAALCIPTNNKMRKAVDKHLNPILGQLGMRKIATDPTSKPKVTFKLSLDGKAVENFIKDLFRGLVEHAPNAVKLWGLEQSRSKLRLRDWDEERAEDETEQFQERK